VTSPDPRDDRAGAVRGVGFRPLLALYFVDALGTGAFGAIQILYFTRVLRLDATSISVGLGLGGFAAVLSVLPFGRFADGRNGPRLLLVLHLALAACYALYLSPDSVLAFVIASCAVLSIQRMIFPLRSSLVGLAFPQDRVNISARCRVAYNTGFAVGGLAASLVVTLNGVSDLRWLLAADIASFAFCALLSARLPDIRTARGERTKRLDFVVLRDRHYALAAFLNMLGSLHDTALFVVMPLWILQRTAAPAVLVPIVAVVNGLAVVLLQVLISKDSEAATGAVRAQAIGVLLFGAGCLTAVLTLGAGGWAASALLLVAALLFTGAELWQSAGAWGLSFSLAPPEHMNQYQSLFGLSSAAQESLGPVLGTALVLSLPGGSGWIVLGAAVVAVVLFGGRYLSSEVTRRSTDLAVADAA
jgi:MFS family permease